MSDTIQRRIQRRYEVTFSDETTGDTLHTVAVNLSYELNEALDAVALDGSVIEPTGTAALLEAVRRIRRLARKEPSKFTITPDEIDDLDWGLRLVGQRMVDVPLGPNGRPIPRHVR